MTMLQMSGRDLRYAARALRKVPAFTGAVVLCLALAVGAAASVFAVVDRALLRPLPYRDPAQLVVVWERRLAKPDDRLVASPANVLDWQVRSRAFAGLAAAVEVPRRVTVGPAGLPEEVAAQLVTPNAFALLGVAPALGRGLAPADARPDAAPVVLLSDAFWRQRLGGDPAVVGRTLAVDGRATTVVGIMPPGTRFLGADARLWAPLPLDPGVDYRGTVGRYLGVIGRLRPSVTPEGAQRDLDAVARRLAAEHPAFNEGWGYRSYPSASSSWATCAARSACWRGPRDSRYSLRPRT
jgi:hypothetical protein